MKHVILAALALGCFSLLAVAADHLDAPGLTPPGGDKRLDLGDVYVFQSPATPANAVIIATVHPLAGIPTPSTFHPGASYDIKIDNDGDAKEDLTYRVTFGAPDGSNNQDLQLRCVPASTCGFAGAVLARGRTNQNVAVAGAGTVRAGLFDDPFFFDLAGFLGSIRGSGSRRFCDAGTVNFFAGLNTLAIVLEVPRTALGADQVGVWVRTELDGNRSTGTAGRPSTRSSFPPVPRMHSMPGCRETMLAISAGSSAGSVACCCRTS